MYIWNHEKNKKLKEERGLSFEEVKGILLADRQLAILDNPARGGQLIYLVSIRDYVHIVPFVVDNNGNIILKTVYPNRKFHKMYKHLIT